MRQVPREPSPNTFHSTFDRSVDEVSALIATRVEADASVLVSEGVQRQATMASLIRRVSLLESAANIGPDRNETMQARLHALGLLPCPSSRDAPTPYRFPQGPDAQEENAELRRLVNELQHLVSTFRIDTGLLVKQLPAQLGICDQPPAVVFNAPSSLSSCALHLAAGRRLFLRSLFEDHGPPGLMMAVNHVWESLAHPKSKRCETMGANAGVGGSAKTALKNVLVRFLEDAALATDRARTLTMAAGSPSSEGDKRIIDRALAKVLKRYEAILDGRDADEIKVASAVIQGPWSKSPRNSTARRSARTRGVHRSRCRANASCEEQD